MVPWVDHVVWWQDHPLGFLGFLGFLGAEKELGAVRGELHRLPGLLGGGTT